MTKEERKEYARKYYEKNREKLLEKSNKFYNENKDSRKEYARKYYEDNKEKVDERNRKYKEDNSEYDKRYYDEHKNDISIKKSEYYLLNKEKRNEYSKKYFRKRKKEDKLFNLISSLRTLINISIKNQGYTKRLRTQDIIGCSFDELKVHLESQFLEGMTWENKGEWHIDHIKPISTAKTEDEVYKLNHYTNLQPLWAIDNRKKGNKY